MLQIFLGLTVVLLFESNKVNKKKNANNPIK